MRGLSKRERGWGHHYCERGTEAALVGSGFQTSNDAREVTHACAQRGEAEIFLPQVYYRAEKKSLQM